MTPKGQPLNCSICGQQYSITQRTIAQREQAYNLHKKTSEKHKAVLARYIEQ